MTGEVAYLAYILSMSDHTHALAIHPTPTSHKAADAAARRLVGYRSTGVRGEAQGGNGLDFTSTLTLIPNPSSFPSPYK